MKSVITRSTTEGPESTCPDCGESVEVRRVDIIGNNRLANYAHCGGLWTVEWGDEAAKEYLAGLNDGYALASMASLVLGDPHDEAAAIGALSTLAHRAYMDDDKHLVDALVEAWSKSLPTFNGS